MTVPPGVPALRFDADGLEIAADTWGCNCGPAALAAITGSTLAEAGQKIPGFIEKRYTNVPMMTAALEALGVRWRYGSSTRWPRLGLARIQWGGPWMETKPNDPWRTRRRLRFTHWVAARETPGGDFAIFDVNATPLHWTSAKAWAEILVPSITRHYRRADGTWSITHAIEIEASP